MKKSKDQGHLIVVNGGGGVVHRKVQAEWMEDTGCHEVGRVSTMVRSLHELEWREEKGEERGFAQRGRHVGGHVPKRENKRGVWYRNEGEDQESTECQEKEKCTVHEYGGCGIMSQLCDDRLLVDPDTDGVRRARGNSELACVVWVS